MQKYNFSVIEKKWNKVWKEKKVYEPNLTKAKKPFYNLMMFPYPSAEGLHVGNMYAFTGSDIYGRFKRMQGYDVFEPIGLDGFGIHSENYAIKMGTHPMTQSKVSEKRFYKQLEMVGNGFAWNEHLETYDPEYYKWTQWIFVEMWRHGLAYRKKQAVNWCPSCKTVLADEQVEGGKCERCGTVVVKKDLEQWFFRITKYADRLLKNLDEIDWSEKVKIAQRNWIGKSEGALLKFQISNLKSQINSKFQIPKQEIEVFTTRPDTLFGATYIVLAPEHSLLGNKELGIMNYDEVATYVQRTKKKSDEERLENKDKTGIELKGIKAVNPANGEEIPIFVADYVLSGYGTGAIMAVPAHDERDFEFAMQHKLPIREVVSPLITADKRADIRGYDERQSASNQRESATGVKLYEGAGVLVNSGKFNGLDSEKAKWEITDFVGGKRTTQFRLRDWLISRQRYWGPPIPMIHCEACAQKGKGEQKEMPGWYAVLEKDLPVKLPMIKDFRPQGKGESPLASVKSFYETKCPACGGTARRETDVSDTFLDSAWYYIGFLAKTPNLKFEILNLKFRNITKRWFPVSMYIGGAEHSVLHLLYVRFIALALRDMKLLDFPSKNGEPFPKFRAHGLVIKDGAKMSKSKGNVVNPDEYIKRFGADAFRMYLMFLAPFEQGGDFREQGILGIERFLTRVRKLVESSLDPKKQMRLKSKSAATYRVPESFKSAIHQTIKKVTEDIENLHYNTAVSALMILLNEAEAQEKTIDLPRYFFEDFFRLLAPFAPYLTEELWSKIGIKGSIHQAAWPAYNPKLLIAETFPLVVQINGRYRATIDAPRDIDEAEARMIALQNVTVASAMRGAKPRKIIFVKNRIINFVV